MNLTWPKLIGTFFATEPNTLRKLLSRGTVLFGVLVIIKIAMLLSLQKHLFQAHLRFTEAPLKWWDWINFAAFVALLLGTFVCIGKEAMHLPVRTIRFLNVWLLAVGISLIALTLVRMEKNYFYPLLTGVLSVRDLKSYLAMDLFFGPPWLAAYLIGYPLLYWFLFRTQRERYSLFVLGGLTALYFVSCMREPRVLRKELLCLNCFAFGGLVSHLVGRGTLSWKLQLLPAASLGAVWFLLKNVSSEVANPHTCMLIVLTLAVALFLPGWVLLRSTDAFPVMSHFLPFFTVGFVLLGNQGYPLADNYDQLLLYAFSSPHYFLEEFFATLALVVLALIIARTAPRVTVPLFDLGALFLASLACADFQSVRTLGVRLEWSLFTMADSAALAWRTIRPYAFQVAAVVLALAAIYFAAALWLRRRVSGPTVPVGAKSALCYALTTLLLLSCLSSQITLPDKAEGFGLTHLAKTSPWLKLWNNERLSEGQFFELANRLDLLKHFDQKHEPRTATNYPNVFLIVLESTYNRYLSMFGCPDETQPLLKQYKDRMELFPNFYSNYPNSCNARFSVLSGLFGAKQYVSYTNPRIAAPSIPEILHGRGYTTSVYQSDPRDYTRFGDYVGHRKVDLYHDCDTMPGKEKFKPVSWGVEEAATMEAIKARFAEHARKQERFFLAYMPVAPHMPFDTPSERFNKFPTGYEAFTHNYTGLYKNQLLYIDWILASLIETLSDLHLLDNTLIIITNDHGEMVGEDNGNLGHGWCLQPNLCNTPLIIMNPKQKGYRLNYTLGSQVDVLPTMLDILGITLPPGELYEGSSLYASASNGEKTVYLNSHHQRALIHGSRYILEDPTQKEANNSNKTTVYEISHQGPKTIFEPVAQSTNITSVMDDFERFQNSLILDYSYYKACLARHRPALETVRFTDRRK